MARDAVTVRFRLVLLPGMDGTGDLFGPLLRALPAGVETTVVRYPTDRDLDHAELFALVSEAVPQEQEYVLLGESFSGPIAIERAAARPRGLRALVLCSTFARNPVHPLLRPTTVLARIGLAVPRPPRVLIRPVMVGRDAPEELVDAVVAATRRVDRRVLRRRFLQILDVDVVPLLPAIEVPVLFLTGSADRLVGDRGLRQVAPHVRNFASVVLPGPHLLLETRPEAVVREILRFVEHA